eukprot:403353499
MQPIRNSAIKSLLLCSTNLKEAVQEANLFENNQKIQNEQELSFDHHKNAGNTSGINVVSFQGNKNMIIFQKPGRNKKAQLNQTVGNIPSSDFKVNGQFGKSRRESSYTDKSHFKPVKDSITNNNFSQGSRYNKSAIGNLDQLVVKNIDKIKNQPIYIEQEFYEQMEKQRFMAKLRQEEQVKGNNTARTSRLGPIKELRESTAQKSHVREATSVVDFKKDNSIERQKDKFNSTQVLEFQQKRPQFYNDPKIKSKIEVGGQVFEKGMRQDVVRQGFSKLLNKIQDSNLTLRQVKNGQTLFEKEMMLKNYNNPFLEVDQMKNQLHRFIEVTKPRSDQQQDYESKPLYESKSPNKFNNTQNGFNFTNTSLNKTSSPNPEEFLQLGGTPSKQLNTQFMNQTTTSFLPPFTVLRREKAQDLQTKLKFPPSPAFTASYISNTKYKLDQVVNFCKTKNIPFQPVEERFYKINQCKQSHKLYSNFLNKCFETNRPDEYEVGVNKLSQLDHHQVEELLNQGADPIQLSHQQIDIEKKAYMPKLLKVLEGHHTTKSLYTVDGKGQAKVNRNLSHKINRTDVHTSQKQSSIFLQQKHPTSQSINRTNEIEINSTGNSQTQKQLQKYYQMQQLEVEKKVQQVSPTLYFDKLETKKRLILSQLPEKLDLPFKEEIKTKKKLSRRKRNDPVRKILLTNKHIQKKKKIYNEKLMRILDRVDLDRPILMHDKLDIIWGNQGQMPTSFVESVNKSMISKYGANQTQSLFNQSAYNQFNTTQMNTSMNQSTNISKYNSTSMNQDQSIKNENKIINSFNVKAELEKRKIQRSHLNQKQMLAYNHILDYLNERFEKFLIDKERIPLRVKPDEKERQFLDAFRIIIESTYTITEQDFTQILEFIGLPQIIESPQFERTRAFFKHICKILGFREEVVDEVLYGSSEKYQEEMDEEEANAADNL